MQLMQLLQLVKLYTMASSDYTGGRARGRGRGGRGRHPGSIKQSLPETGVGKEYPYGKSSSPNRENVQQFKGRHDVSKQMLPKFVHEIISFDQTKKLTMLVKSLLPPRKKLLYVSEKIVERWIFATANSGYDPSRNLLAQMLENEGGLEQFKKEFIEQRGTESDAESIVQKMPQIIKETEASMGTISYIEISVTQNDIAIKFDAEATTPKDNSSKVAEQAKQICEKSDCVNVSYKGDNIFLKIVGCTLMKVSINEHIVAMLKKAADQTQSAISGVEHTALCLLRYAAHLHTTAQHWGRKLEFFKFMAEKIGIYNEAFASPLNSRALLLGKPEYRFCSLYPDTDAVFGSMGSFFDQEHLAGEKPGDYIGWMINPPFTEKILEDIRDMVIKSLEKAISNDSNIIIALGWSDWTDMDAYRDLHLSPYKAREFYQDKYNYHYKTLSGQILEANFANIYFFFTNRAPTEYQEKQMDYFQEHILTL